MTIDAHSNHGAPDAGRTESSFLSIIHAVADSPYIDEELARRLASVSRYLTHEEDTNRPFLTVLLRTQGRRIETFRDSLLCLEAQTSQDFEVIVLEHDAIEEDARDVRRTLTELPESFAERVNLIEVRGGSRARPLNIGVAAANGRYLAVYDDDDLVFANWVQEFASAAAKSPGKLVRAVVANQSVIPEMWPQDQDGFRTTSWPRAEYSSSFDPLSHLVVNSSPFMSWAFPRALFHTFGLRFDEQLLVCEDWDVILRGSLLCGVVEVSELTALYRRWEVGESSYNIHSSLDWRESEQRVIDRIDDRVLTLPPGSMKEIRDLVIFNAGLARYRFIFKGSELRQPLLLFWKIMAPFMRLLVRVRNRYRRLRMGAN